jgi:hypothetical protein
MKWKRAISRSTHPLLVVGGAVFVDKWGKWWITRGLGVFPPGDNLWTGKRIAGMACDTYKGLKTRGGRRSGVR